VVIINLKTLQQQFLNALDDPSLADNALQIYQKSMQGNLAAVLCATFPVCHRLVGDDFFRQLAKRYIAQTTHSLPDITHYGEGFPQFVAQTFSFHQLCYLADVAKLEWACHYAVNGPSTCPIDHRALAAVRSSVQSQLIFELYQNSTLIHSPYPILEIWEVNQASYEGDQTVDLGKGKEYLLVHVRNKALCIVPLSVEAFKMLTYFAAGLTFEAVCQRCIEEYPQLDIPRMFADFIKQQYLIHFRLS
jgi:hypothetical protein